ncbi:snoRNA-binding rRNA-processing protein utp10, partial [Coemansia sp. RSA 532]
PLADQLPNTKPVAGEKPEDAYDAYISRVRDTLAPAASQLMATAGNDAMWKMLNQFVMLKSRSDFACVRHGALLVLQACYEKLGEEYLILLPETIPYLAELLEDDDSRVERATHETIRLIESYLGESLQSYLRVLGLRGLPCLIVYFVGVVVAPSMYWSNFLGIDEQDFGGKMEILNDSIGSGAAMFMLSWRLEKMSDQEAMHVTLVKYESGLGVPGIMAPQISNSVEISAAPNGGQIVRQTFDNNRPGSKQTGELSANSAATVLNLVTQLTALPVTSKHGGPDVFGANTVVLVRQGKQVVWGYNPGAGCCAGPDAETEFTVSSDHKAQFAEIVSSIYQAGETAL